MRELLVSVFDVLTVFSFGVSSEKIVDLRTNVGHRWEKRKASSNLGFSEKNALFDWSNLISNKNLSKYFSSLEVRCSSTIQNEVSAIGTKDRWTWGWIPMKTVWKLRTWLTDLTKVLSAVWFDFTAKTIVIVKLLEQFINGEQLSVRLTIRNSSPMSFSSVSVRSKEKQTFFYLENKIVCFRLEKV